MNERDNFDALLAQSIGELPPDDIAHDVSPWRQAMDRIVFGVAFSIITLNFLWLQYILPTIGAVMLVLGFRSLRRVSPWFMLAYIVAILRLANWLPQLILNATVLRFDAPEWLTWLNAAVNFVMYLCLWRGLAGIRKRLGLNRRESCGGTLLACYCIIAGLAMVNYPSTILAIIMIISVIVALVSLDDVAKKMEDAGYAVTPAPCRVSDSAVNKTVALILALGIACGYIFLSKYPMDWQKTEISHSAELDTLRTELTALGFPEDIIYDIAEEDILYCSDALDIKLFETDIPLNNGREVEEYYGESIVRSTVYDQYEVHLTGIAVILPGDEMRIFHHFTLLDGVKFPGTEAVQLWPTYHYDQPFDPAGEITGQLLFDKNGSTQSSPYFFLGEICRTANYSGPDDMRSRLSNIYAEFSVPHNATNRRGYICYGAIQRNDVFDIISQFNYVHQSNILRYPVQTSAEYIQNGGANLLESFTIRGDYFSFNVLE